MIRIRKRIIVDKKRNPENVIIWYLSEYFNVGGPTFYFKRFDLIWENAQKLSKSVKDEIKSAVL